NLGSAVVVVTDGSEDLARTECGRIAADLWQRRRDYLPALVAAEAAVREAHQTPEGLVVLSDSADATTSGAPGGSNWILRELLKYEWPRPALVTLVDPALVEEARRLGVGGELCTPMGGKRDRRFSEPITVAARVAGLFEARFTMSGHLARNLPIYM